MSDRLPGQTAHETIGVSVKERSIMVLLKDRMRLERDIADLVEALGLDPTTTSIADAVEYATALNAFHKEYSK